MNKTPTPSVSTLPCLFSAFVQKYNLSPCETKKDQTWRRASGNKVVGRVNIFAKYFTELSLLIDSLNEYSVCEKHYNQIIMTDNFLEKLKAGNTSTPSSSERTLQKKLKLVIDNDTQEQVEDHTDLLLELEEVKKKLVDSEYQKARYSEIIIENKQRIIELELQNEMLLSENNKLKERLNSRFIDQKSRVEAIIEIAQQERKNLYEDIINLIDDQKRFTLDSLLTYSPSEWLAKRNPVIVKFIEVLTHNENRSQHQGEKLFKCAVAVDAIWIFK